MVDDTELLLEREDVKTLVELGFMAITAGMLGDAETIFQGITAARPDQEAGPLGLAMVRLAQDRPADAVALLKKLPPSEAVLTYLGLAQARHGDRAAAARCLHGVIASAPNSSFADMAGAAISEFSL
ncbi:tetratricopeptide repeat protein [Rhizobium oryzicola]|uniref:Tetratricopeptide repeat protein n=1 Tax=Rhizobium oryzicola TaxID=1232668 RepID=A0ABT8SXJ8_9HYPH|nr:tetratricopeptide repeat protein [Rhizobium oryzicola]MDO1583179.1 tetratricopeptide repeat protein [Rhizobium oryzicola]